MLADQTSVPGFLAELAAAKRFRVRLQGAQGADFDGDFQVEGASKGVAQTTGGLRHRWAELTACSTGPEPANEAQVMSKRLQRFSRAA
jgi:hypothetical protein